MIDNNNQIPPFDGDDDIKDDVNVNEEQQDQPAEEHHEEIASTIISGIETGVFEVDVTSEVRSAFLDYSMSVIVSRALPDVRDGFKPVHRRIIYAMNESGMTPDKPYKKCARIVGDVMGKYHPHGDQAIYSTLVRLAQPFSMRYPLVEGHGNFGSIDGDEAAAMRYTEARLSKISMEMVRDINYDTVDFIPNYDGTENEPLILPSRIPNLLINGSSGIAVGMATNIPPHNLSEVINAIHLIAKEPDVSPLELMNECLYGPDFPTGGIILGRGGIKKAYETGQGSVVVRAKTHVETLSNGKTRIVVDEVPYIVNKARMIEKIAELVKEKRVDGITDIRDESNKEGIRVVIELRKDVIPEVILNQLFKMTQLQSSFGVIMLTIVDGEPRVLPITKILQQYLDFQIEVTERKTRYLLEEAELRKHKVSGLLKAIDFIDEIVSIIRNSISPEEASINLQERFDFDEIQTKEILAMTLRRLTGLEKGKLEAEFATLVENIETYTHILSSRENVQEVVLNDLDEIKQKFGDDRRTEISDDLSTIDDEDLIPVDDVVISLTNRGYIKRTSPDAFRIQHRGGKGVIGMQTLSDDVVEKLIHTNTHTDVLFFTNLGKVYRLRAYQIPEGSRTARGIPVQNLIGLDQNETVKTIISIDNEKADDNHFLFFVTKEGVVKRTSLKEFESIRVNGKIALTLKECDELLDVKHTDGTNQIGIASKAGKMVKFVEDDIRAVGRNAQGVIGMSLDGSEVVGVTSSSEGKLILALSENGFGKMSYADDYRLTKRGAKGVITLNVTEKTGQLVGIRAVNGDEDLLVITETGTMIRINLSQVSISGRNTQGVRIIRLDEGVKVSSFTIVAQDDLEIEEETE